MIDILSRAADKNKEFLSQIENAGKKIEELVTSVGKLCDEEKDCKSQVKLIQKGQKELLESYK